MAFWSENNHYCCQLVLLNKSMVVFSIKMNDNKLRINIRLYSSIVLLMNVYLNFVTTYVLTDNIHLCHVKLTTCQNQCTLRSLHLTHSADGIDWSGWRMTDTMRCIGIYLFIDFVQYELPVTTEQKRRDAILTRTHWNNKWAIFEPNFTQRIQLPKSDLSHPKILTELAAPDVLRNFAHVIF